MTILSLTKLVLKNQQSFTTLEKEMLDNRVFLHLTFLRIVAFFVKFVIICLTQCSIFLVKPGQSYYNHTVLSNASLYGPVTIILHK